MERHIIVTALPSPTMTDGLMSLPFEWQFGTSSGAPASQLPSRTSVQGPSTEGAEMADQGPKKRVPGVHLLHPGVETPPEHLVQSGALALLMKKTTTEPSGSTRASGSCAKLGTMTSASSKLPPALSDVARAIAEFGCHSARPQPPRKRLTNMCQRPSAPLSTAPPHVELPRICRPALRLAGSRLSSPQSAPRHAGLHAHAPAAPSSPFSWHCGLGAPAARGGAATRAARRRRRRPPQLREDISSYSHLSGRCAGRTRPGRSQWESCEERK